MFVIINNAGIIINVNVKNWLTKEGLIWKLSKCECDKSCDVGEYLDHENCNCRKKLVDKLVEEYT